MVFKVKIYYYWGNIIYNSVIIYVPHYKYSITIKTPQLPLETILV